MVLEARPQTNDTYQTIQARELVLSSGGIEETRALAEDYSEQAIAAVSVFPDSEAKDGLIEMVHKTLQRRK
jgi:hexaprenyl-diphosphate synthase